jgi:parallel beta-helix repeat protein
MVYGTTPNILTNINASSNSEGIMLDWYSNLNTLSDIIVNNTIGGITIYLSNSNNLTKIEVYSNSHTGIWLSGDSNNLTNIKSSSNEWHGICLLGCSSNIIKNSKIENNNVYGIYLVDAGCGGANKIYNNLFNNQYNFGNEGTEIFCGNYWNTTRQNGTRIYSNGTQIGGNYWTNPTGIGYSDTCIDSDKDGFCDEHYNLTTDNIDYLPLSKEYQPSNLSTMIFDTGSSADPYPSVSGIHNGTITPSCNISVNRLYTYPCPGTGGHTEYVKIWNSTGWNATATWNGYVGDWHNITFNASFVLYKGETYNYTIKTGSYPQINHNRTLQTANGWINCTEFVDANGKRYYDWIPAIRLWAD